MGFFERYLTLWVAICIIAGTAIGNLWPGVADALSRFTYAEISLPIAVLIWLMIFPMMLQIDFASIKRVGERKQGLVVTTVVNWLIKPFTMFGIAWLFFNVIFADLITPDLAQQYLAGAVLLGAAPCTAMVFVWSYLADGDPAYTLVQVAVNDLIMLVAFVPIVSLLLGIGGVPVPWDTMALSVMLFVVVPLVAGWFTRKTAHRPRGCAGSSSRSCRSSAGHDRRAARHARDHLHLPGRDHRLNPLHILLIAIPLIIQTFLIFAIAYGWAWAWRLEHPSPRRPGSSARRTSSSSRSPWPSRCFGLTSGAALATVVGVLVEVPVMLALVWIAKRTRGGAGFATDFRVEQGMAVDVIPSVAADIDADLIIVTDRGKGGAAGRILGSTAERIAQAGEFPVLVVRVEERDAAWCRLGEGPPFAHPLVAADLDETLERIAKVAGRLPGVETARVLHVAAPGADVEQAHAFIDAVIMRTPLRDAEVLVVEGKDPAEVIAAESQAVGASLIVLAPRRHGLIGRIVFGSVALSLLRESRVPLLFA
jgi:arsenite transporter